MITSSDNSTSTKSGLNIFLIGFMGCGKTYWGRIWAEQTGKDFYDLDEMIESETGKSIAAIFEDEGEDYFRKIETATLQSFADKQNCLIACGGGTPCFNNNMQWMNKNGTAVYLQATAGYILKRVSGEKDKRPLISKLSDAGLLIFIEQKLKEREPFYKQASRILIAEDLDIDSLSKI